MRFLINNRVIFDEDNLTLALADENADPVVLTAIANRLLALLVKNNNILISRDFIFSAVWEEHGKTASNSNLNNYIASLRRTFAGLGENEILVTVPRQGFMFAAENVNTVADTLTQEEIAPASTQPLPAKRRRWSVLPIITLLLLIAAGALAGQYFFVDRYEHAYQHRIATYKSCSIDALNASEWVNASYVAKALEMLKQRGFDCDIPASVYFYQLKNQNEKSKKSLNLLSYCPPKRTKNVDVRCENAYEVVDEG
ncbi:helix-turn-helix domain-containing protein [Serratia nematodiphila]|nr:helix-turn-helix domain-containing protein [Serratia nematodiphila]